MHEAGKDGNVEGNALLPHGRNNHAAGYVCLMLGESGLETRSIGRRFMRSEEVQAVEGLVVVAWCDPR